MVQWSNMAKDMLIWFKQLWFFGVSQMVYPKQVCFSILKSDQFWTGWFWGAPWLKKPSYVQILCFMFGFFDMLSISHGYGKSMQITVFQRKSFQSIHLNCSKAFHLSWVQKPIYICVYIYIYIDIYIYTRNAWALPQRCSVEGSHSQSNVVATLHSIGKINKGIREY